LFAGNGVSATQFGVAATESGVAATLNNTLFLTQKNTLFLTQKNRKNRSLPWCCSNVVWCCSNADTGVATTQKF